MKDDDARDFADELELRGFAAKDGEPRIVSLENRSRILAIEPVPDSIMTEEEKETLELLARGYGEQLDRTRISLAARRALEIIRGQ